MAHVKIETIKNGPYIVTGEVELIDADGNKFPAEKIETIKNGPYIVTGEVELIDADGNKFPAEKRMALCRCGASTEKPFCDGTHSKIGFQAAQKAVPESKE